MDDWRKERRIKRFEDFKEMTNLFYYEVIEGYYHRFTEKEQDVIDKMAKILDKFEKVLEEDAKR
jgi:hypothetical protein